MEINILKIIVHLINGMKNLHLQHFQTNVQYQKDTI